MLRRFLALRSGTRQITVTTSVTVTVTVTVTVLMMSVCARTRPVISVCEVDVRRINLVRQDVSVTVF